MQHDASAGCKITQSIVDREGHNIADDVYPKYPLNNDYPPRSYQNALYTLLK